MPKRKRKFMIVNIGGDRSWISARETGMCGDDDQLRPPPGEFFQIYIPGTNDWLLIADIDTLKDPKFVKKNIQGVLGGLYTDYGEQVLDHAGVKWHDDEGNWTYC